MCGGRHYECHAPIYYIAMYNNFQATSSAKGSKQVLAKSTTIVGRELRYNTGQCVLVDTPSFRLNRLASPSTTIADSLVALR